MEKPLYPKEWLNLKLEFKEDYLSKIKRNNCIKENSQNKTCEELIEIPIHESVLPYDKKDVDYGETLKKYDKSYKVCCSSKSCSSKSCSSKSCILM